MRAAKIAAIAFAVTGPLLASPSSAFLISTHRTITENATRRVSLAVWEQEKLIKGSADADLVEGGLLPGMPYDEGFHFDNLEKYAGVEGNFRSIVQLMRENVARPIQDPWGFGKLLHPIQDFYSHSNYVPIYRQYRLSNKQKVGSIPTLEEVLLEPAKYPGFDKWLVHVRTGYYPNKNRPPDGATDHGHIIGPGQHKDSFQRDFHIEAMETAERATAWYLLLYKNDPATWAQCDRIWK